MTTPRLSLGRVTEVRHDPRSLNYAHGILPRSAVKSVRWTRRIPVLDQGSLGSCTGNAAAGCVGTDSKGREGSTTINVADASKTHGVFTVGAYGVDENFAVACYELATALDTYPGTYPPEDTGSDGLAAAKTLQAIGLVDVYTHGFSVDAAASALQNGPIMIGVDWYNSQFDPQVDGRIPVNTSTGLAGGHELCMDEIDTDNGRFWVTNSWGDSWGVGGRGYFTIADFTKLLSMGGDVTVPHLVGTDTPTPTPPPAGRSVSFTDPQFAAIKDWADSPHWWSKATKASKAWKAATG